MAEETKFTKEELDSIATLQRQYQEITFRLGQLHVDLMDIENRSTQNAVGFDTAKKELENLRTQEKNLAATFQSKYGEGSLNFETGIFTPVKKAPQPAV